MQNTTFDYVIPWIVDMLTTFAESTLKVLLILGLAYFVVRSIHPFSFT